MWRVSNKPSVLHDLDASCLVTRSSGLVHTAAMWVKRTERKPVWCFLDVLDDSLWQPFKNALKCIVKRKSDSYLIPIRRRGRWFFRHLYMGFWCSASDFVWEYYEEWSFGDQCSLLILSCLRYMWYTVCRWSTLAPCLFSSYSYIKKLGTRIFWRARYCCIAKSGWNP